ncbi:MAG: response regulator [Clostridia bacterium]
MTRILVVDDSADMRESLRRLLASSGYDAEAARDGLQALEVQRRRPAAVLITDIYMPLGDGIETIAAFRREFPRTKIIAMSGGGRLVKGSYLGLAGDIGADATLEKPFEFDALLEVFSRLEIARPA